MVPTAGLCTLLSQLSGPGEALACAQAALRARRHKHRSALLQPSRYLELVLEQLGSSQHCVALSQDLMQRCWCANKAKNPKQTPPLHPPKCPGSQLER